MMIMPLAAGIESRVTIWTLVFAIHVLLDSQLCTAASAKDRFLIPLTLRPHRYRVACQLSMAIVTGIVEATAFHFDGNDVRGLVIVPTTSLEIEINAADVKKLGNHLAVRRPFSVARQLTVPRKNHRFAWHDRQNGFPESSDVSDLKHLVCACDYGYWDGHRE